MYCVSTIFLSLLARFAGRRRQAEAAQRKPKQNPQEIERVRPSNQSARWQSHFL